MAFFVIGLSKHKYLVLVITDSIYTLLIFYRSVLKVYDTDFECSFVNYVIYAILILVRLKRCG